MRDLDILVIGGGIGGLTAAIALRASGHRVTVIERDPAWSVYGVGIIQQGNVLRAMKQLGLLDDYLSAAVGFDFVAVHAPDGTLVAKVPSPRLVDDCPANVGIGRRALHEVLTDRAIAAGAHVRLGLTVEALSEVGVGVSVRFSDGREDRFAAGSACASPAAADPTKRCTRFTCSACGPGAALRSPLPGASSAALVVLGHDHDQARAGVGQPVEPGR